MTDILVTKIYNTFETYNQNIMSFLSRVLNHVHGIEHLDKTTLTGLLEQATDHTEVFQQNFDFNGYNFLKCYTQDNSLINLFNGYELFLNVVRATFAFAQELEIDKGDYPVPRTLRESEERLASCYKSIQHFLVMTQPSTNGTMTTQIETEDQATQDNAPPTPSDTPRHPVVYPDTELDVDSEHDPELDSKDQSILAIETTDTLDNSIDNSDPTLDNSLDSSINDCTNTKQTVDNNDIGDLPKSKTETIDDNLQEQTDNIDSEDQDNSEFEFEIIQTDNNSPTNILDFNSPIDFNDHRHNSIDNDPIETKDNIPPVVDNNSPTNIQDFNRPTGFTDHNNSMAIPAEINNSHKESKSIESKDESDSKSFESERIHDLDIGLDIDSDVDSECDFDDLEAIYLDMCKNFRTKIPARKPIPLFSFG